MEKRTIELKAPVPRGMLFLYDHSGSNIELPTYSECKAISFTETAVSIATISDLDGQTEILLTNSEAQTTGNSIRLFSGQILLETGNLHICIIGDEIIASFPSNEGKVNLDIFGDAIPFPKSISIFVTKAQP